MTFLSISAFAVAFQHPWPQNLLCRGGILHKHTALILLQATVWEWLGLGDRLQQCSVLSHHPSSVEMEEKKKSKKTARVIRTAARQYIGEASTPSSRDYTTRKDELPQIQVARSGVEGDYNHYRTVALKSTPDRSLSILTNDVVQAVKTAFPFSQPGDLGENVLLEGISFRDLVVGQQYEFGGNVIAEITEPMMPCANLCKLPYINDDKLEGKQRIQRCQSLLEFLDQAPGFRGWYAKVVQPGLIRVGDEVLQVGAPA
jgi:MOSC domain-containing protein YiiM